MLLLHTLIYLGLTFNPKRGTSPVLRLSEELHDAEVTEVDAVK